MIYLDVDPLNPDSRPGKGEIPADYAMVGIAPSPNRPLVRDNEPFGASSWNMLKRIKTNLNGTVYTTNLLKTPLPSGKKPKKAEVTHFYPLLIRELQLVRPKRVLALGTAPAQVLCPGFDSLREDHGTLFFNPDLNCVVVPTFHFSAVARDPSKSDLLSRDLERFATLDRIAPPWRIVTDYEIPGKALVYLDLETTGLNPHKDTPISMGLGLENMDEAWIVEKPGVEDFRLLHKKMADARATLVGHNLGFDLDWLQVWSGEDWSDIPVEDTMMIAHVLGEEILALKHLTTMYTDRPGSRAFGGPNDYSYLAEDVLSTREIYNLFQQKGAHNNFAVDLLNRLVPFVLEMKNSGTYLDRELLKVLYPKFKAEVEDQSAKLNALAGREINWNSNQQVVEFLLEQGVRLTERTDAGAFSVKESVLLELAKHHPMAQNLLTLREREKELTFLESYDGMTTDEHPWLHPKLLLTGTRTGRLSCKDPNVQQVKRTGPIKLMYRSRFKDGYVGLIDLSQAELRIADLLSNDEEFAQALLSDDVHRVNAAVCFDKPQEEVSAAERKKSKGITFGLLYGGSAAGLATRTGLRVEAVEEILEKFFQKYPRLQQFIKRTKEKALREQEIRTPMGRVRSLRSIILVKGEHDAERKAINTPIQGTASDVALMLMLYCGQHLKRTHAKSRVIFGVHDSILLDIHPAEIVPVTMIVKGAFLNLKNSPLSKLPLWSKLPLVGELVIGKSWAHVESTNENYDKAGNMYFPCSSLEDAEIGGVISERDDEDESVSQEDEETEDYDDGSEE